MKWHKNKDTGKWEQKNENDDKNSEGKEQTKEDEREETSKTEEIKIKDVFDVIGLYLNFKLQETIKKVATMAQKKLRKIGIDESES